MKKRIKKNNKFKLVSLIVLVVIACAISSYFIINQNIVFKLNGNKNVTIYKNNNYEDLGFDAKLFKINLNDFVVVEDNIETSKLGDYEVIYKLEFLLWESKITRNIKVIEEKTIENNDEEEQDTNTDEKNNSVSNNPNEQQTSSDVVKPQNNSPYPAINGYEIVEMGPKYVNGILVVNKRYAIPKDFKSEDSGLAASALKELQAAALVDGFNIELLSGYRSYSRQKTIYEGKVTNRGYDSADRYSARPGHSEHQTGLAFDVGSITYTYGETASGKWLNAHCAEYGFIIRYPEGKEHITGYGYEPWHIRYVGKNVALEIMNNGLTLEEYLDLV